MVTWLTTTTPAGVVGLGVEGAADGEEVDEGGRKVENGEVIACILMLTLVLSLMLFLPSFLIGTDIMYPPYLIQKN